MGDAFADAAANDPDIAGEVEPPAGEDTIANAEPAETVDTPAAGRGSDASIEMIVGRLSPLVRKNIEPGEALRLSRSTIAFRIIDLVEQAYQRGEVVLAGDDRRNLVTILTNQTLGEAQRLMRDGGSAAGSSDRLIIAHTKQRVQPLLLERIDVSKALALSLEDLTRQIGEVVGEILSDQKLQLNAQEQRDLVTALLDDLLGLGPLEALLGDETVTDIMVNGPTQVYVERKGKLSLTDVTFRDNA
ncbi:MAG TPA: hypothetical protein VES39_07695, partial [Rhodospirillales bacterium]|nr:hypothetical protein [Rhodospirillales bacterium]